MIQRKSESKSKTKQNRILVILLAILVVLIFVLVVEFGLYVYSKFKNSPSKYETEPPANITQVSEQPQDTEKNSKLVEPTAEPTPDPKTERRGKVLEFTDEIKAQMNGKSMHENPNITYEDLAYLEIPHYDFNYEVQIGHLVVNKAVAEDVLDIFAELYDIKYPIERMELIDKYDADDYASIDNNNTSAFNYRMSTDGTGRLSKHALGRAIDINPKQNPYVNGNGTGSHSNAKEFWSRNYTNWSNEIDRAAYIGPEVQIYQIFINHGWEWGGSWSSYRDYQHFQKTAQ